MNDIRWKQRFQNFDRAFVLLRSALEDRELDSYSELEKEGIIQRFEYSFELAWKTIKDYLEYSGIVVNPVTPRNVIKEAFAAKLITDGQVWIDMMLHRNLLTHTYDFRTFQKILEAVQKQYLCEIGMIHELLMEKMMEEP